MASTNLKDRYELKHIIAQGGMGVLHQAYDSVTKRDVAIKTIRNVPDELLDEYLRTFQAEIQALSTLHHPHIIEFYDVGVLEEAGQQKPFFVMPLLEGTGLDELLRRGPGLSIDHCLHILAQVCLGLHAAHCKGIIHRDVKPSNVFVLPDWTVKLIDFGVARVREAHTSAYRKGTLRYMAPEQLEGHTSAATDLFALGVMAYEMLTLHHPFERETDVATIDAIRKWMPPPVSDINPAVTLPLARVIHKALAKRPEDRYLDLIRFREVLLRLQRNEPVELSDPEVIRQRLARAAAAFQRDEHEMAEEILRELDLEGHLDEGILALRRQVTQVRNRSRVEALLRQARRYQDEGTELTLARQKVMEALEIEPEHPGARQLKGEIEAREAERVIERRLRLAADHAGQHSYENARQELRAILKARPHHVEAAQRLQKLDFDERDYERDRQKADGLFQEAQSAFRSGDLTAALSKIESVLTLDRRAPDRREPQKAVAHQQLFEKAHAAHAAVTAANTEARRHLDRKEFRQAAEVCDRALAEAPSSPMLLALKAEIDDRRRLHRSERIVEVDQQVRAEPDLVKKVQILKTAAQEHPGDEEFEKRLENARQQRDYAQGIVQKARQAEEGQQFSEALNHWQLLKGIHPLFPNIDAEINRLTVRLRQHEEMQRRADWTGLVDRHRLLGQHEEALLVLLNAREQYPDDTGLRTLEEQLRQQVERTSSARTLAEQAQVLAGFGETEQALALLRQAVELDPNNAHLRVLLVNALVREAGARQEEDAPRAKELAREAQRFDSLNSAATSIQLLVGDQLRERDVETCLAEARQRQGTGDLEGALEQVKGMLRRSPGDPRLAQLRSVLEQEMQQANRQRARQQDVEQLLQLQGRVAQPLDMAQSRILLGEVQTIAGRHADDQEVRTLYGSLERKLSAMIRAYEASTEPAAGSSAPAPPPPVPQPPPVARREPALPPRWKEWLARGLGEARAAVQWGQGQAGKGVGQARARMAGASGRVDLRAVSSRQWAYAGGTLAVVLVAGIAVLAWPREGGATGGTAREPTTTVATIFPVNITSDPPGAEVRVNGELRGKAPLRLTLSKGSYILDARLDGHKDANRDLRVEGTPLPAVELRLEPLPPTLRATSQIGDAELILDDQRVCALTAREAECIGPALEPRRHTLVFRASGAVWEFPFTASATGPPVFEKLPARLPIRLVFLHQAAGKARLFSNIAGPVSLAGRPMPAVSMEGVDIDALPPGEHRLGFSEGGRRVETTLAVTPAPALYVLAYADLNVGGLQVTSNVEGAQVYLDGELQRRTITDGLWSARSLSAREHRVRVVSEGHLEEPERVVVVRRSAVERVDFALRPKPTHGEIVLTGGLPGTTVLVGGQVVGTIGQDGRLTLPKVTPGEITIELRPPAGYTGKTLTRRVVAGEEVALTRDDLLMSRARVRVTFKVEPKDSKVQLRQADGTHPVTTDQLDLEHGRYILIADAEGYKHGETGFEVGTGPRTVELSLEREAERIVVPTGMEGWTRKEAWAAQGDGWTLRSGTLLRSGDLMALYRNQGVPGQVTHGFRLRGQRFGWVFRYLDAQNHTVLFMDDRKFYLQAMVGGVQQREQKHDHQLKGGQMFTAVLKLTPTSATLTVHDDQYSRPGEITYAFPDTQGIGHFGFVRRPKDQLWIKGFQFAPAK